MDRPMKSRLFLTEKPWFQVAVFGGLIGGVLLIAGLFRASDNPIICRNMQRPAEEDRYPSAPLQLRSILHYATSHVVPQQSLAEISISFDVLRSLSPCNFLVFGLGHDSLMWASLNPGGTTLFLEEDPKWVQTVLKGSPDLQAYYVKYRTQLSEADHLLSTYKSEPECFKWYLKGNEKCKLALNNLPNVVYEKEWDLIMVDAPRGYFAEAPGRMAAIYSAAVMGRNRKRWGMTHVFLHDVDRKVEKRFAEEFLCRKHLVKGVGRLWHFEIPPSGNDTDGRDTSGFC